MSTKTSKRVRRSAEESRALILDIAQRRLASHGLDGLNIADIAAEAGMSHGTLLHHFGSSDGMRKALADRMGQRLLEQVLAISADLISEIECSAVTSNILEMTKPLEIKLPGGILSFQSSRLS